MARKYSKGKKPEETMRQRQRRLIQEQQARKAAQTNVKSTPDSNPAKRGAQGPRNPSKQGPYRKPVSAMQGDTGRTGATDPQGRAKNQPPKPAPKNAPPTQKYKPRVSNVGPQIRQAKAVQQANPGRAARAARRPNVPAKAGAVAGGLYTAAQILRSSGKPGAAKMSRLGIGGNAPVSKPNRKEGQKATLNGKPVVWRNGKWVPAPSQSAGKYNTKDADGTVRSRKKVGTKKVGTIAQSFDRSYAAAKKAGKKTFTFRGKKYTTD